ncbi:MAG: VOC family protein [Gammaproteobacteria bacterium]|nr:VOC family protein [Gammaproteobacteria bacterium]
MLVKLDHVNIRSRHLDRMVAFYTRVLGLTVGPRPDFSFPGVWLYCGADAVVHLIGVNEEIKTDGLKIEHFAFRGENLEEFIGRLQAEKVPYRLANVPGWPLVQVNVWDCDGNHIHVDFEQTEDERNLET